MCDSYQINGQTVETQGELATAIGVEVFALPFGAAHSMCTPAAESCLCPVDPAAVAKMIGQSVKAVDGEWHFEKAEVMTEAETDAVMSEFRNAFAMATEIGRLREEAATATARVAELEADRDRLRGTTTLMTSIETPTPPPTTTPLTRCMDCEKPAHECQCKETP